MKKFEGMLLSCDMDGTLLNDSKQIPAENKKALQYFAEQGGRISIATGRSPHAIDMYMDQLPINAPYSVMNGSLICNENREMLRCEGMPQQTKDLISRALLNNSQIGCEIFTPENALIRQMSDYTLQHMHKLHLDFTLLPDAEFTDSSVDRWCTVNFTGEPDVINDLAHRISVWYPDIFDITSSISTFCEITAAGVNKGSALSYIAEHTPDIERIFAIGDSFNDAFMLRKAELSFAPESAEPDICKIADVVVSSNNKHAVADMVKYLERIV